VECHTLEAELQSNQFHFRKVNFDVLILSKLPWLPR